jgi:hypothetical protein
MRVITGENDKGKQAQHDGAFLNGDNDLERESQQSVRYQWQVGKLKL